MDAGELVDELTTRIVKPHYTVYIKVPGEDKLRPVTEFDVANVNAKTRELMPYDLSKDEKLDREVSVVLTVG